MEETFAQIAGAAQHSPSNIDVSITDYGTITGKGVASTTAALSVCGGNVDQIIRSFGGIQGGSTDTFGKASAVLGWGESMNDKLEHDLGAKIEKMEHFVERVEDCMSKIKDTDTEHLVDDLAPEVEHMKELLREAKSVKHGSAGLRNQFSKSKAAVHTIKRNGGASVKAGALSLAFGGVNKLRKHSGGVEHVVKSLKTVKKGIKRMMKDCHDKTSNEHMKQHLAHAISKHGAGAESEYVEQDGGELNMSKHTESLADRLSSHRDEVRRVINGFVTDFSKDIGEMVNSLDGMAEQLGKRIDYDEKTITFIETFKRLNEFINSETNATRNAKLYQYLLELNKDQVVDAREVKDRFVSLIRDLSERAAAVDATISTKQFADACKAMISHINKYNDEVRNLYDMMRKSGGASATDTMNELFSIDASRINISTMSNALNKMSTALKKINFFSNLAVFRSNLERTSHEVSEYSKDYHKTVGKAIGDAISKIDTEYAAVIQSINDNKAGMGLEIDMYNESKDDGSKISKENLKIIHKWQHDARVGLYKTVEAIDLYLLHFTENVTKNPDAVSDLQKLLSTTRAIAKWYDEKVGDNIIRVFETLANSDTVVDDPKFYDDKYKTSDSVADLSKKIGNERAVKLYERCRRAIEGVVVLKNIISYFINISEKYGTFKGEKNIYMSPTNIYKNLVNYIWVSALSISTSGIDVVGDNNEVKRVLTYRDTEVGVASISEDAFKPEFQGINFNKNAINKIRILKSNDDLKHLEHIMPAFDTNGAQRLSHFITMLFARLGKTKYIFHMYKFGIVDLTVMDDDMVEEFVKFVANDSAARKFTVSINTAKGETSISTNNTNVVATIIKEIPKFKRNEITFKINIINPDRVYEDAIISLDTFKRNAINPNALNTLFAINPSNKTDFKEQFQTGFLSGMLRGMIYPENEIADSVATAKRIIASLSYLLVSMLNEYNQQFYDNTFAIDDTYFVLTIKAIAGKIMAVTGINAIFKNPDSLKNTIANSPTRLIMGGAEDAEVIDGAVELYVRLPLLVEFYRRVFEDGNQKYKEPIETKDLDNEQISFVPEVGNIWSDLLITVFDKSKHIDSGIYTIDNIHKIISAINGIYKHFKGKVADDELTRHVIMELVAEVNRRYGVIKRQELLNYYKVVKAVKDSAFKFDESSYSNNDADIINEIIDFQETSPSDEYIKKMKEIVDDKTIQTETKINKLTDYKIVKDFRERITEQLENAMANAKDGSNILSLKERIRFLKRAVASKASRSEKYDMIIKSIEESNNINNTSIDIFMCFHEFVVMPLSTVRQMYEILHRFILTVYKIIEKNDRVKAIMDKDEAKEEKAELNDFKFDEIIPTAFDNGFYRMLYILNKMVTSSGDLVKININTNKQITIDFSEYQKVCEYLVANVKYMIDKFTGLVPSALIEKVTKKDVYGSIYYLEEKLVFDLFNKQNNTDSSRKAICVDNLMQLLPAVSDAIFNTNLKSTDVVNKLIIKNNTPKDIEFDNLKPFIRDIFMQYDKTAGMYIKPMEKKDSDIQLLITHVSTLLFDPFKDAGIINDNGHIGLIQEFNTILANYINDLYDTQSKKIYSKAFGTFASSALIDALNGQSIKDFSSKSIENIYHVPGSQTIISSTLAYAMKVLINRIHPINSTKIHDLGSIQEISPHMLEKYRMLIPMYLRICNAFIRKCKIIRKVLNYVKITNTNITEVDITNIDCLVKENISDTAIDFASIYEPAEKQTVELIPLYVDELINATSSLVQDIEAVQTELLESDNTVTMYFDVKKDFTKNYMTTNKETPFAPLSILAMGYVNKISNDGVLPLYRMKEITSNKFLYGLRTMLSDNFVVSLEKVPYLKKLLTDFNGYSAGGNVISEAKLNDVVKYVGQAANFIYDIRFYTSPYADNTDFINKTFPENLALITYQESNSKSAALTMIESTNALESANKISNYISLGSVKEPNSIDNIRPSDKNTRLRVMMVNIIDLNIIPLNVHSLMREIPLANLYNYAMTFDEMIDHFGGELSDTFKTLLKNPYDTKVFDKTPVIIYSELNNHKLRFISDIVNTRIRGTIFDSAFKQRLDTKLLRNLIFLTLVQHAIKLKIKHELDFVNTRVVSNIATVSDVMTERPTDAPNLDSLFEF